MERQISECREAWRMMASNGRQSLWGLAEPMPEIQLKLHAHGWIWTQKHGTWKQHSVPGNDWRSPLFQPGSSNCLSPASGQELRALPLTPHSQESQGTLIIFISYFIVFKWLLWKVLNKYKGTEWILCSHYPASAIFNMKAILFHHPYPLPFQILDMIQFHL